MQESEGEGLFAKVVTIWGLFEASREKLGGMEESVMLEGELDSAELEVVGGGGDIKLDGRGASE